MEKIMLIDEPNSAVSESYRNIRSEILFANIDNKMIKIMITSSTKSEGKTTLLCNLAYSMAELGYKTLLLDCDLRRPSIHKKFRISNLEGVTDILLKKDDYHKYVRNVNGVDILTSGPISKNPPEIISSNTMRQLLDSITMEYDYVFIDTPPVLVLDPFALAKLVDGVLFVVKSAVNDKEIVKKNISKLKEVNNNIIGIILNGINSSQIRYKYKYYDTYEEKPSKLKFNVKLKLLNIVKKTRGKK